MTSLTAQYGAPTLKLKGPQQGCLSILLFPWGPLLDSLVCQGLIDSKTANRWSENHTIVIRSKGFFRTLTDKWKTTKTSNANFFIVVGKPGWNDE